MNEPIRTVAILAILVAVIAAYVVVMAFSAVSLPASAQNKTDATSTTP